MSPACLQSIRLLLAVSIGILLDFHWFWSFGCGFAVSPLEVHWKSPLDFVVQPKMPVQALENHQKNTVVKKQKIRILLTLSPTESTQSPLRKAVGV